MPMLTRVAAFACLCAPFAGAADYSQTWRMKRSRSADHVHFTIERSRAGSQWTNSTDVPLSRFRRLSLETFDRGGDARFEYVHDAGRLLCTGGFSWGRGSGTWTFEPNAAYVSELQRLGYAGLYDEQILSLFMHDVGLDFARGVRNAGLQASVSDLVQMRIHGVRTEFIQDLKASGYDLPVRDIVQMRIHGVTSELIAELKRAGYSGLPGSQIVQLRIHGVSPQYVRELQSYGLRPPAADLVQLKIHGVSPEYLKGATDAGYANLSVRELIDMRNHGVQPELMRAAKDLGYQFTIRELIDLRVHGVDAAYLRRIRDAGMKNLTASQIQKLKVHGVY